MTNAANFGSLWFVAPDEDSCEVLNNSRTRHYQTENPLWRGAECPECECPQLDFDPCTETALIYGATPGDATNPAPWYDPNYPCSAEFLGFIVSDIDGLDYGNVSRTVNQRAGDGSNLTPMRLGGRELTYSLIGTATSQCGMRWGLDWLAASLMRLGGRCSYGKVVSRLYCHTDPDGEFSSEGLVELREVALKAGPVFDEVSSLDGYNCHVQGVRFSLIANDPCFYGCRSTCLDVDYDFGDVPRPVICVDATPEQFFCGPLPAGVATDPNAPCCEVEPTKVTDVRAAIVTIHNLSPTLVAGGFAIDAYAFVPGVDCHTIVGNPAFLIGTVGVGALNPGEWLQVDGASQAVWFRLTEQAEWVPSDALLVIGDEFPCFPRLQGCDSMYVTVRPLRGCVNSAPFRVTIDSIVISGCAC